MRDAIVIDLRRLRGSVAAGLALVPPGVAGTVLALTLLGAGLAVSAANVRNNGIPQRAVDRFAERYDDDALVRLGQWSDELSRNEGDDFAKAARANDFFNTVPWRSDDAIWNRRDYWATPFEMLGVNAGDCEDFSIGKYFTLRHLDVPGEKLLITYVRAPRLRQTHMVLAYYPGPGADPYILDNLTHEIRRGSERRDLIPVYSFNARGLWKADGAGRGRRVGQSSRLNAWRGVLKRMQQFGWEPGR